MFIARTALVEIAKRFLKQPYRMVGDKWVMTNCPFSKYTHADGDDKRYSFGMSTDGGFNCFTCGLKGSILDLSVLLARYTHVPQFALEEFISENIFRSLDGTNDKEDAGSEAITFLDDEILCYFDYAPEVLSLTREDILKWNIRYDAHRNALFFPIYVDGKLHCIKVRLVDKKVFWVIGKMRIKATGNWYGDWFEPRKWLFLVEGERDAIFLSRYTTAWASLGAPSLKQIERIAQLGRGIKVVLFFDNDKSGLEMRDKVFRRLGASVHLYYVKDYCGCKDPAEVVEQGKLKAVLKSLSKF